jgi:hypothetical protein
MINLTGNAPAGIAGTLLQLVAVARNAKKCGKTLNA